MQDSSAYLRVKFGEAVWHDRPYVHPQLRKTVPKDFYDRNEIIEGALQILFSWETRKAVFIVGERRAGKTSMLKLLLDRTGNTKSGGFVPVAVPWLSVSSLETLMKEMLSSLYYALGMDDRDTWKNIRNLQSPSDFQEILGYIAEKFPHKTFVFGIDEFDTVLSELIATPQQIGVVNFINMLIETESLPVKMILSSVRDIQSCARSLLLIPRFVSFYLTPFSDKDLNEMIDALVGGVTEVESEQILSLSGGWPYFAKAILYHWLQKPPDKRNLEDAIEKAIDDVARTWEFIYYNYWNDEERMLILLLAKQEGLIEKKYIQTLGTSLSVAAEALTRRGYLLNERSKYRFRVGLLLKWLERWPRFPEQYAKYLGGLIENKKYDSQDIWMKEQDDIIDVTWEELRHFGL